MRTIKGISALLLAACSSIASAEGWQLHGFGDISVRNDYVTPRGLVVTTSGAAVQVLNGLVAVSPGGVAFHGGTWVDLNPRSEEHTSELQSLMRISYAVFCLKKKKLPTLNKPK